MINIKKALFNAGTEKEKNFLDHKSSSLYNQINSLVCQIYSLTENEIKIIEQN